MFRITAAVLVAAALVVGSAGHAGRMQPAGGFAARVASLSEPGGYFDTDNLISNERSYLEVIPELERRRVHGGAYIGVGPDQNFSYIAGVRPSIAFIVDIRRDNLLLHLLFKALFQKAESRIEYLALLFGRSGPDDPAAWRASTIERLTQYVARRPLDAADLGRLRAQIDRVIRGFGVPLSGEDMATIDRFHRRFIEAGLGLKFETTGRGPQSYYPTYGELLAGTDGAGRQRNYLASEESFQYLKAMQARDGVVPVVGNLSGPKALAAIARLLRAERETLTVLYASNVEFYLQRQGTYPRFLANLSTMPRTPTTVVIRSIFNRGFGGSLSVVQPVDELLTESPVR